MESSDLKVSNKKDGKTKREKCPHCGAKLGRYPTKCYKCGNELISIGSWQPYETSFGEASRPSGFSKKKIAAIFIVILIVISLFYSIYYIYSIIQSDSKQIKIIDQGTGKKGYVEDLLELIEEKAPLDYELITNYVDTIYIKETLTSEDGESAAGLYVGDKTIHLAAEFMGIYNELKDASKIVHEATHSMIHNLRAASQPKSYLSSADDEYSAHMREAMFLHNVGYYVSYEKAVDGEIGRWEGRGFSINPNFNVQSSGYSNDCIEVTINKREYGYYFREWNMYYTQGSSQGKFDFAIKDSIVNGSKTNYQKVYNYYHCGPSKTEIDGYKTRIPKENAKNLLGVDDFMLSCQSSQSLPYNESMLYDDVTCQSMEPVYLCTLSIKNIASYTIHGGMVRILADVFPHSDYYFHYPIYHNEIKAGENITINENFKFLSHQRVIVEVIGIDVPPIYINDMFELKESQHPNYQTREYYKMNNKEAEQIWENVHQNFTVDKVLTLAPQKETKTSPSGYTYNLTYYMENIKVDDNYLYGITAGGRLSVYSKDGEVLFEMKENGFLAAISDNSYIYTPWKRFGDIGIKVWSKINGSLVEDNIYYKPDIYLASNNGSFEKVIGCYELDDLGNYQLVFYYLPDSPAYDSVVIESVDAIASSGEYITLGISYKIAKYDVPGADSRISYSSLYYFLGDIRKSNLSELPYLILDYNHTKDIWAPCNRIIVDGVSIYYEIEEKIYTNLSEPPVAEISGNYSINNELIYKIEKETIESFRPFDVYYISCNNFTGTLKKKIYGSDIGFQDFGVDSHHIYAIHDSKEVEVWKI